MHDSFGKGFHKLTDHVLKPFNDRAVPVEITAVMAEVPLAFSPKYLRFSKSATFKGLNRHLECTDISFNPEKGAVSKIKK